MSECRFLKSVAMMLRGLLRMINDRIDHCCRPERPGRVMVAGRGFHIVSNLKECFALTQKIEGIAIRGDIPGANPAYVTNGAVVIMNSATPPKPLNPQPPYHTLGVSFEGLKGGYVAETGQVAIIPDDDQPPSAPWKISVSAVETGTEDDFEWSGFYTDDVAGGVDGLAAGDLSMVTDRPAPAVAPPAPDPQPDPQPDPNA